MIQAGIKERGIDETAKALDDVRRELGQMNRTMIKVAEVVRAEYSRQFRSEGALFGQKWKALSKSTQRQREKLKFPPMHPILQRTGGFKGSFTSKTSPYYEEKITSSGGKATLVISTQYTTKAAGGKGSNNMLGIQENIGRQITHPDNKVSRFGIARIEKIMKEKLMAILANFRTSK